MQTETVKYKGGIGGGFPTSIKQALEQAYEKDKDPSLETRKALAAQLGLAQAQVCNWFDYRRRKARQAEEHPDAVKYNGAGFPTSTKQVLEQTYKKDKHPSVETQKVLAAEVGLTPRQVNTWFSEKRRATKLTEEHPDAVKYKGGSWGGFPARTKLVLEQAYKKDKYPSLETRKALAAQLGLTPHQVSRWFIDKRRCETQADARSTTGAKEDGPHESPICLTSGEESDMEVEESEESDSEADAAQPASIGPQSRAPPHDPLEQPNDAAQACTSTASDPRVSFETEHGYYMCGVNGCVLEEHHRGACAIPVLGKRSRTVASEAQPCAPAR